MQGQLVKLLTRSVDSKKPAKRATGLTSVHIKAFPTTEKPEDLVSIGIRSITIMTTQLLNNEQEQERK